MIRNLLANVRRALVSDARRMVRNLSNACAPITVRVTWPDVKRTNWLITQHKAWNRAQAFEWARLYSADVLVTFHNRAGEMIAYR